MTLYSLYAVLYIYQCFKGFRYLAKQRKKPKYMVLYYSSEYYQQQATNMELNFQEWNHLMRLRLEAYYRVTFVLAFSNLIQNIMILSFLFQGMNKFFVGTLVIISLFLLFSTWVARRLLVVKHIDKNRMWRRKNSFIITEAKATTGDHEEIKFGRNKVTPSEHLSAKSYDKSSLKMRVGSIEQQQYLLNQKRKTAASQSHPKLDGKLRPISETIKEMPKSGKQSLMQRSWEMPLE